MIVIIKACGSNINSVLYALQRLNADVVVSDDVNTIKKASHVILPGVGHADFAMQQLQRKQLIACIQSLTQPVLGICLGMQLLFSFSQEGEQNCLDIIPGQVNILQSGENPLPHMGWNTCDNGNQEYFYFVHSYAVPVGDYTVSRCHYGETFSAVVKHNNFNGCQFHPEKSSHSGEKFLKQFLQGE